MHKDIARDEFPYFVYTYFYEQPAWISNKYAVVENSTKYQTLKFNIHTMVKRP